MLPPFVLLTLSLALVWLGASDHAPAWRRFAWVPVFGLAVGVGMFSGIVGGWGPLWLALLAAALVLRSHLSSPLLRGCSAAAIVALVAGLMTHLLPGFQNPLVLPPTQLTPDALPYRLHFNFDKTAAGVLLLALLHPRLHANTGWGPMLRGAIPVIAVLLAIMLPVALLAGYVRFDPKFPAVAPYWLWANLCFTCVAEEAFFRGFVQHGLQRAWQGRRHGRWLALAAASVLFGVAHAAGGPVYVALSTLAGFGYGLAFQRTGRLEASILAHFSLNAVHFLGFTYPALAR